MIRTMIVEDSRLARLELKSQLALIDNIELVAEAENVKQAVALYAQTKPDLVFLDVNLPDGSGFDFLSSLALAPKVIFTTAFEEFALQAFDNNAIDYLLKPYTQTRLQHACLKLSEPERPTTNQSFDMMNIDSPFFVKDGNKCWLIKLGQVERFEAMGNYTVVHFDQAKPMVYRSLAKVEQRLPQDKFFRVSRHHIVQLSCITHVEVCSSGGLELSLQSGAKVEVSRRQTSLFKTLLAL